MSNKSNGTAFEREFAQKLSAHGFWAHCLKENANGQPFDVVAAKNGISYVFDCKDCQGDVFRLSRIEENQHNAMTLWAETGNQPGLFALRFPERTYLIPHRMLMILKENGTKQISQKELVRYAQNMEQWLENRDRLKVEKKCR